MASYLGGNWDPCALSSPGNKLLIEAGLGRLAPPSWGAEGVKPAGGNPSRRCHPLEVALTWCLGPMAKLVLLPPIRALGGWIARSAGPGGIWAASTSPPGVLLCPCHGYRRPHLPLLWAQCVPSNLVSEVLTPPPPQVTQNVIAFRDRILQRQLS